MEERVFDELKTAIYETHALSGRIIADILLEKYRTSTSDKGIYESVEFLSDIWGFLENILETDTPNAHPYFQRQSDQEQSKKGLLGSAWELVFAAIANELLEGMDVRVIKLSKDNVKEFVYEKDKQLRERFKLYKRLKLVTGPRYSKGRIVDSFYKDMVNQLRVYIDDEYKVQVNPDRDLIAFKHIDDGSYTGKVLVLAVLSAKKKFRERIAQVGYWTVKFRHTGSKVKNFLVTPDEDKTFLKEDSDHKKIAEIDTDGTYVIYQDDTQSEKIKHLKFLREAIEKILQERIDEIEEYRSYGRIINSLLRRQNSEQPDLFSENS